MLVHNNQLFYNCTSAKTYIHISCSYLPPLIWGKSGHLQTFIYGKLGRVKSPYPLGKRISVKMSDGATMTFDVFEPHKPHPTEGILERPATEIHYSSQI